ncbi:hypothetical protein M758_UG015900 [Ceratodon purpureus]|nr:hypothetical protein M758_UG015900 [Ceratodon purpureus]
MRSLGILVKARNSMLLEEVPLDFGAKTRWLGCEKCVLETSLSALKEWPLRMTALTSLKCLRTSISDSAWWSKLEEDQGVGVGNMLVFEVVDER